MNRFSSIRRSTRLACLSLLLLATGLARAQVPDVCLSATGGLAGVPALDGMVSGDAGWNGATQVNLSGDSGATTASRLLMGRGNYAGQPSVFIGIVVDAPSPASDTTVVLAFVPNDGSGSSDWRLHIKPFATGGAQVTYWQNTSASHVSWNLVGATAVPATAGDWPLKNMKVMQSGNHWEMEVAIPIAAAPGGIAFGSGANPNFFRFYANVLNTSFGSAPTVGQDVWPPGSELAPGPITQTTPDPGVANKWSRFWLQGAPADACTGVKLQWANIGVQNPTDTSKIINQVRRLSNAGIVETSVDQCELLPDNAHPGSNGPMNVFVAKPENTMGISAPVSVTFRLADWGIPGIDPNASTGGTPHGQQASGLFKPLGAPVPLFTPVPPAPPTPVSCDPTLSGNIQCAGVPAKGTAGGNPTLQTSIGSHASTTFQSNWQLNYKQSCYYKFSATATSQGTAHQCLQVDMDSTSPDVRFLNRSVQTNMDFVPASTIRRLAIVSGDQGPLPAAQTKHRFLLQITEDEWASAGSNDGAPRDNVAGTTNRSITRRFRDAGLDAMAKQQFDRDVNHMLAWIARSYLYTGTKIIIDGRPYEYVRRAGDFGIVAGHQGAITGWRTALASTATSDGTSIRALDAGSTLFELEVEPGHRATLEATITAEEAGASAGSARYALWLAAGAAIPHGSFGNQHARGFAGTLGFEVLLAPSYALEATLGRHSVKGRNGGGDIDITQFGVNGKWYVMPAGVRPFLTAGVGGYAFDPGSTRFGANVGAGVQVDVAPQWSVEGRFTLHQVASNAPNARYSTLQLGLRYGF